MDFYYRMKTPFSFVELIAAFLVLISNKEALLGDVHPCPSISEPGESLSCEVPDYAVLSNLTERTSVQVKCWMEEIEKKIPYEKLEYILSYIEGLQTMLEKILNENISSITPATNSCIIQTNWIKGNFTGMNISASESKVSLLDSQVERKSVHVQLPQGLLSPLDETAIMFHMLFNAEKYEPQGILYGMIVGVHVSCRVVSGLLEPVVITVPMERPSSLLQGNIEPKCKFYNFSTKEFEEEGCFTNWKREHKQVVCSCNHLTHFAVLMVSPTLSLGDLKALTFISLVGCSLSLLFLLATVALYKTYRKVETDVSLHIHLNLVLALILLNVHFLANQLAPPPPEPVCVFLAIMMHYSLLATFCWTAAEGFHIYLLLVRVYNIYIRRYLLKLCLVSWGFPLVIVVLIVIIKKDVYQRVTLPTSVDNATTGESGFNMKSMCYLQDGLVKHITTLGFFCLVFLFNMGMVVVVVLRHFSHTNHPPGAKSDAGKNICTLLGITSLLGITWGLVFFTFGHLSTVGVYLFCILNSLQGIFIFLWFCHYKAKASAHKNTMSLMPVNATSQTGSVNTGD